VAPRSSGGLAGGASVAVAAVGGLNTNWATSFGRANLPRPTGETRGV